MNEFLRKYRWCQAERIKGLCLWGTRNFVESATCLKNALARYRALHADTKDPAWSTHISHDLGMILYDLSAFSYENGDMLAALTYAQETLEISQKVRTNFLELAKRLNLVGYLRYQCGEYQAAWESFQEAQKAHEFLEKEANYINFLASLGDLYFDLEEWKSAEDIYLTAIELGKKLNLESHAYGSYAMLSRLRAWQGEYAQGFQYLRETARVQKLGQESVWYRGRLGEIYLEMGQVDLAIETLQPVVNLFPGESILSQDEILILFWLSRAFFERQEFDNALLCLENCLKATARLGYDQFLVIAGRRAIPFLSFAVQNRTGNAQLLSLFNRASTFKVGLAQYKTPPAIVEQPAIHLELFAFGEGYIRRNGQIIAKSAWRSSKAKALIFYFIERREKRNADIRLDFWPDFGVGQATSNFQATLWRTRHALGGNEILINEGDRYTLGPKVTFWYDVDEFRNFLKRAQEPSISEFEKAECWRQAIQIYRGDYLEDVFMEWADSDRTELRNLFIQTLVDLASWTVRQRQYDEAKILFEQALSKDNYRDDIHLALMQCLVYSGAPSAAIAHFLEYEKFLKAENISPSQVLVDYYRHLRR